MSQAYILPRRNRGKPGELLLAVGLVLMFAAPVLLAIIAQEDRENAALVEQGVVASARVTGLDAQEEAYTDRRGRQKSRTVHYVALAYDLAASEPYGEWRQHRDAAPSDTATSGQARVEVSAARARQMSVGQPTNVIYIPGNAASIELVDQLEYESSWTYHLWHYLAMGVAFVAGLAMAVLGFRRRFG